VNCRPLPLFILIVFLTVLYGVGIVELELEKTSALILLLFVVPLAFTLSGFLMWILHALNGSFSYLQRFSFVLNKVCIIGTIAQLRARKQRYKLAMFRRLYKILIGAIIVIAIFFVVSSLTFTGRLAEGAHLHFAPFFHRLTSMARLLCQNVASPLVAPRRMAGITVLRFVRFHLLLMAAFGA
jgi:hypothetical protein